MAGTTGAPLSSIHLAGGRNTGADMSDLRRSLGSPNPPYVGVIPFAFLVMTNSTSAGLSSVPAWLVTPEIVISPPDVANGFVLLTIRVTEFVDGSYDGAKLTGFGVVTVFFLTRLVTVEKTSNVAPEMSTGMLNWNRNPPNTGLPTGLPFFNFCVVAT